jgi:hypothetical protein
MASLSNYLKQQYASALESELAGLKNAYDQNTATLDRTAQEIPQQYETQRNTVAATNALEKQAFDERANAMGLNTGTSGQAQLAKSSVYQRDLANLGAAEAGALADLDLKRATLKANYENEMARARAANEAALNQALYAEMVRQEQAAAAAAAAAAKAASTTKTTSGGGSGYNNGNLSTAEVKRMQQFINSGLPANQQIAVNGKWGAETTAAAGASANDFAREYYRQNSWSGRSDR